MKKKWFNVERNYRPFFKWIRVMKLTLFFLLAALVHVSASVYSQQTKLSISMRDVTVKEVLKQIEEQSEFVFLYKNINIDLDRIVSVDTKEKLVENLLDQIFGGTNVTYEIVNRQIVLVDKGKEESLQQSQQQQQQQKTISGKITDFSGGPIPGASVVVKGTTIGITTSSDGMFTLAVPVNATILVFSFVGMKTQEVPIGGKTTINVSLAEDAIGVDEVVVIGYGTQKKSDVTGAVAGYDANDIRERPVTRVDQALVGQMAGVQVKQTTGVPGKAFSVQIRGTGSISAGNEPLYVIDGFPLSSTSANGSGSFSNGNPLDNMNPSDIESIQVLKDAASAAIYGSRASNGVVIITTKQGKKGKPQISLNISTGYNEASRKMDLLNPEQFIDRATEMINSAWVASGTGRTATQTTEERRLLLGLAAGSVNTNLMLDDRWTRPGHPGLQYIDWQNEAFRKGIVQNYQVSASGANDNVKYYISGNYAKQEGMIIDMDYTNFSARANVEVKATSNLTLGINLAPSYSITNDPGVEGKGNMLHYIISLSPVQEQLAENVNVFNYGAYKWLAATTQINSPITRANYTIGRIKRVRTLASGYADYQIIKGLNFKITANLDNTDNNAKSYVPYTVNGVLTSRQLQPGVGTTGSFLGYRRQTFLNENTLSYNKVFNAVHDFSAVAGVSYNSEKLDNVVLNSLNGYGNAVITTLNAASAVTGNTSETRNVLLSYFGRVQYSYNNRYLLSVSLRSDGSSRFGENSRYGSFPSASIGWRVSNENFMKSVTLINDLKIRTSYGESGNYNIGDYSSIPLLGINNYTFNSALAAGQSPVSIINPNLSWETCKTIDVGFDITLLKNRISSSFDYYIKTNKDLLLNVPIPRVTGFPSLLNNVGEVQNKGWEFEIRSHNLTGRFQWTTAFNLSHNANKIVALANGQTQILIPSSFDISHSILQVGQPMYSIYVVKQIGILSKEDIANKAPLFGAEKEGDPKYMDVNNDKIIDANDRQILGHPTPDYIWGLTNSFKYKGFDLGILIQGQSGGSIYSLLGRSLNRTGMVYADNALASYNDRWRSAENPGNGTVGKAYSTFGRIKNTDWLYSSDYWRIRNITLGYNLGDVFNSHKGQNSRVYITAENFYGKDKYTGGFNPEATNTDLSGSTLFPESGDYGGLPMPRSLIIGLNITF